MQQTKIFTFDLDGTLFTKSETIHPSTKEVLLQEQAKGNKIVIATGRGLVKMLALNHDTFKFVDYLVCSNGALVHNMKTNTTYTLGELSKEMLDTVHAHALKYDLVLSVDGNNYNGSILPNGAYPKWMSPQQVKNMNIFNEATIEQVKEAISNPETKITQMAMRNQEHNAKEATENIMSSLKDFDCEVYLTNSVYTDINPKNISKWAGIMKIVELEQLKDYQVVAFGDSGNDVHMLSEAHVGVAMGNATIEAKSAANFVIGDNDTNTIGQFISENF
ncbi:Cof-type HAD-IIB family hydrolase [Mycoplasma sp. 2704]|uniref:Cof-type HAD-IIB family hydrolase n=1 Tax=unclassified Mycoplasma TaxID=2683645 RepID=UPI002B1D218F|nr:MULTISPECIES: Cof-type HAD-IIB family hydrolase [unclassified Mycoplasma]MEA4134660.1 Cof-type HAD-IIB family hydrolase [Mycoplasma sp. 2704]MEA4333769.1 Cof-type HAD-IIB family hydrolase [Mycoplasma sp. 1232]